MKRREYNLTKINCIDLEATCWPLEESKTKKSEE